MSDALRVYFDKQAEEFEQRVQQALSACGGDPMYTVRALVIANTFLMEENERLKSQISTGFDRCQTRKPIHPKNDG